MRTETPSAEVDVLGIRAVGDGDGVIRDADVRENDGGLAGCGCQSEEGESERKEIVFHDDGIVGGLKLSGFTKGSVMFSEGLRGNVIFVKSLSRSCSEKVLLEFSSLFNFEVMGIPVGWFIEQDDFSEYKLGDFGCCDDEWRRG